ncbi:MAG: universal stress protein [Beijerinckiaceae bacterium]|nr:universal stress protein [Beijerinckiaceae bacterium]
MNFRSVFLGLGFDQLAPNPPPDSYAAENYALAFSANEHAHLSVFMAAPILYVPSAGLLPLVHSLVDEVNAERRQHAEAAEKRIANAAAIAGVITEFHIVQKSYTETCQGLAAAARRGDIAVITRPANGLSLDQNLIEAMLFTSGRPVLVIPPDWDKAPRFVNIMVAWDGSARAARAAGDSLPLLTRAERIEILCASPDASKCIDGADLAVHLSRHCKAVTVTELPVQHGDIARTLGAHARMAGADLLVMGAYGHSRLLEMVLGGVTSAMLAEAELPLLLSY